MALKVIKPGMDTRQVITRFEAERQALAMMDHPNIANVLDAGQTDAGRPPVVAQPDGPQAEAYLSIARRVAAKLEQSDEAALKPFPKILFDN